MRVLVTGGAGFIGSAVVRKLVGEHGATVMTLDKLTYAGNLDSLAPVSGDPRHAFRRVDICSALDVRAAFEEHQPSAVLHLAAESHVDRSIDGPADFIQTNLVGTFVMLEEARRYWGQLSAADRASFRFVHVSTDEVYGSLGPTGHFHEETAYQPSSPYSASKAGSDHLARAWQCTYGLPVIVTNTSNNYGPYQFPEKLIPLMILNGLEGKELPVYGRGENVRDWLYVDDHAGGLITVLTRGEPGETYCFGGNAERRNIDVVQQICETLDELSPDPGLGSRSSLIRFVEDRPGHDLRYAIDSSKAMRELGWRPTHDFEGGLRKTVSWYLENPDWWGRVRSGEYRGERLGLKVTV